MKKLIETSDFFDYSKLSHNLEKYRKHGVVTFKSVLSTALCDDILNDLSSFNFEKQAKLNSHFLIKKDKSKILQISPIINLSSNVKYVIENDIFTSIISNYLKADKSIIFRDKAIFKPPSTGHFLVHQDYSWWHPYPANSMCTVIMSLCDCTVEHGPVQFYEGTHSTVLLPRGERRTLTAKEIKLAIHEKTTHTTTLSKGDITLFHPLALHWSPSNISTTSRPFLYIGYIDAIYKDAYRNQLSIQVQRLSKI